MVDDTGTAIAALRALGAHRHEPLRFHFVSALARRSATQAGAVRALLEGRLASALADLQQRLAAVDTMPLGTPLRVSLGMSATAPVTTPAAAAPAPPGPLAALLRQRGAAGPPGTAAPELKAVQQFGSTWARLRVDQQLLRSQARQPENAGPLNSQRLMLQTLQQLRNLSPAYLQRFMAHADALLWLEAASPAPLAPAQPRGDAAPKRRPGRPGRNHPA